MRNAEIRVRRMGGHLLVAERDVLDPQLVAGIDQRVVRVPALPKDFRDAFLLEAVGDEHRSGHGSAPGYSVDVARGLQTLRQRALNGPALHQKMHAGSKPE